MKTNIIVPRLGSSDESDEVRVLRWIKAPGSAVIQGEAVLEVETDKVNVEIEAPVAGTLAEVSVKEGDFVKFGAVVAVVDT
jgi:2-oxoglutarate dehydrogenase E2 component (dihydrolipoamide succinyltransferase)